MLFMLVFPEHSNDKPFLFIFIFCQGLVKEITDLGGIAASFAANILDDTEVAGVVESTVSKFGGLNILVNNAGV
jgi:NAD(P)-dependent dehydrogenase (short-subunit alcohol dehydrogenase family)